MEANFFRCLARELGSTLAGERIERIFNPAPGVWSFKVHSDAGTYLVVRSSRKGGLVFLADEKPANPAVPTNACMWLRKRLEGRRLLDPFADWQGRRIAWALTPGEGAYLLLDMAAEPQLVDELPSGFGDEAPWPDAGQVLDDAQVWRTHPQISPALRRTLMTMPPARAQAVLGALERGGCSHFFVYMSAGETPRGGEALPWRLPPELHAGRTEHVFESALAAAQLLGSTELYPELARLAVAADNERLRAQRRKLSRSLDKLAEEESRMRRFVACGGDGELLRAWMYTFDKSAKRPYVDLPDFEGNERRIDLDPRLSLCANMERLFHLAAKGRRGLAFAATRREALQAELDALDSGAALPLPVAVVERPRRERQQERTRPQGVQVGVFRTSDGFTAYRGRSAKGNHELLSRLASPFDLWFHAAGGPGSHVVLKRDYPEQPVPRSSIIEAAVLAGLKSHYTGAPRAEVMCALVKHVRKSKGLALGQVAVDRVIETILVDLDPQVQERLTLA
ncbi:hypothetical protein GGQ74_001103 [Desulfobaculum xiamenense]|uniref:NFACT RNA-binding domain-containing protein n=1 Tax=Desulfobaculum xiamenense TaxID=995050 RepID=A0A846QMJ8_9BACT|nr:NFACT RNA binding domain-containing protein [Desulfobaculum xiamenense]NJB67463.1 hypothetical protein [Desulfobaculum xiamenense]